MDSLCFANRGRKQCYRWHLIFKNLPYTITAAYCPFSCRFAKANINSTKNLYLLRTH